MIIYGNAQGKASQKEWPLKTDDLSTRKTVEERTLQMGTTCAACSGNYKWFEILWEHSICGRVVENNVEVWAGDKS